MMAANKALYHSIQSSINGKTSEACVKWHTLFYSKRFFMPELPEVETTLRGISSHIKSKTVSHACVRHPKLRWEITPNLSEILANQPLIDITRRAKYLIFHFETGILLVHLGMSGSLRIVSSDTPLEKHEHVDLVFTDKTTLRYKDPRRFGAILWFSGIPEHHPLLSHLGPEPLAQDFNGKYLFDKLQKQKRAIKLALMDNIVVVGVGNIYANESLFHAHIHPNRPASSLTLKECQNLVKQIKEVLAKSIELGGSTLKDFVGGDGKAGYFQQTYFVYGRQNQTCRICGSLIEHIKLGQRASFFCPTCQKTHE